MSTATPSKLSVVLDALRFPMIFLVLYVHVVPIDNAIVPPGLTGASVYTFITEFIAHNLGRVTVSTFFLISGYLFFRRAPETFSWSFFTGQWRKRLMTLVVPYLLWNLLKWLMTGAKAYAALKLTGDAGDWSSFWSYTPYEIFWASRYDGSPMDEPLWYLRDLIVMGALSPLFYLLLKHLRALGLVLLLAWYLSTQELGVPGLSLTAIFYFGFGAYWSLTKGDMLRFFDRWGWISLVVSLVGAALVTLLYNTGMYKEYFLRLVFLLGVVGSFGLMSWVVDHRPRLRDLCLRFSDAVFFIYAVHELYFKSWVNGAFARLPLMDNDWVRLVGYALKPLVLLGICWVLYYLVRRFLPRLYGWLTGGRA